MYLVYGLFILMLIGSIGLLSIPFIKTNSYFSNYLLASVIFIILFSLGLYQWSSDHSGLKQWLTQGKQHYQLMEEVNQLGGVTGMIEQIKKKLSTNPQDAEGWFILGKLYLAHHDFKSAKEALGKAMKLRPDDKLINHFYDIAVKGN